MFTLAYFLILSSFHIHSCFTLKCAKLLIVLSVWFPGWTYHHSSPATWHPRLVWVVPLLPGIPVLKPLNNSISRGHPAQEQIPTTKLLTPILNVFSLLPLLISFLFARNLSGRLSAGQLSESTCLFVFWFSLPDSDYANEALPFVNIVVLTLTNLSALQGGSFIFRDMLSH